MFTFPKETVTIHVPLYFNNGNRFAKSTSHRNTRKWDVHLNCEALDKFFFKDVSIPFFNRIKNVYKRILSLIIMKRARCLSSQVKAMMNN